MTPVAAASVAIPAIKPYRTTATTAAAIMFDTRAFENTGVSADISQISLNEIKESCTYRPRRHESEPRSTLYAEKLLVTLTAYLSYDMRIVRFMSVTHLA
jgi:hypothetical protein